MRLQIEVSATLNVPEEIPATLQIEVIDQPGFQSIKNPMLSIFPQPPAPLEMLYDLYGNPCRRFNLELGDNTIEYSVEVDRPDTRAPDLIKPVQPSPLDLPFPLLHYLLPSRYCPSDRMVSLALDMFGMHAPGYSRVQNICEWIFEHVYYRYGASDASTDALDTFVSRSGVCRDFAHLAISFCRALNIPARYASGYCLGLKPPDFHAFFQAYLDNRWVTFDATENQPRPALISVALGQDAADCAWCTIYGPGETKFLSVNVSHIPGETAESAAEAL